MHFCGEKLNSNLATLDGVWPLYACWEEKISCAIAEHTWRGLLDFFTFILCTNYEWMNFSQP